MNILFHLVRFPGWGGIETVTEMVGNPLLELGHHVSILTHMSQERDSELLRKIKYYKMPNEKYFESSENYAYAEEIMKKGKFDVLVYQDSYSHTARIVTHLSKKYNVPLVVFEHNSPLYYKHICEARFPSPSLAQRVYSEVYLALQTVKQCLRKRYLLKACSRYVLLSKAFISEFEQVAKYKDVVGKLTYINNPVTISPKSKNRQAKQNIILYVGQCAERKRIDLMLNAWEKISKSSEGVLWKFVCVGDGPQKDALQQEVVARKIERVEFVGYKNPEEYYLKAKIFWMMSSYEGWGMTLVEAMQSGCVPVAYDTFSSLHDIVDDSSNGYIIFNKDEKVFINRTMRLMSDEKHRKLMEESAMEKVKNFELPVIISKWNELLSNV